MELKILLVFVTALTASAQQDNCGLQPLVAPPAMSRIVGGHDSHDGAWPWIVSIQVMSFHKCGGTILNSLYVLTATHCFTKLRPYQRNYLNVVAGINVLSNPGSAVQIRTIKKIKMHQHFNTRTYDHDVALLLLSSPLIFNDHIQPACTVHNVSQEHDLDFSSCFISGWGSSVHKGKGMNILQEAEVQLFDRTKCNQISWYHGLITRNMICAGLESGAADACQGDSGGPLQCYSQKEKRFYLVGVSSHGKQCGNPLKPGVYARISRYAGWVSSGQTELVSSARGLNTGPISAWFKATPTLLGCILSVIITHLC